MQKYSGFGIGGLDVQETSAHLALRDMKVIAEQEIHRTLSHRKRIDWDQSSV